MAILISTELGLLYKKRLPSTDTQLVFYICVPKLIKEIGLEIAEVFFGNSTKSNF